MSARRKPRRQFVRSDAEMCKDVAALADTYERIIGRSDPDKAKKVRKIIASLRAWRREIRTARNG